jgi:hypothetical protein
MSHHGGAGRGGVRGFWRVCSLGLAFPLVWGGKKSTRLSVSGKKAMLLLGST